MLSSINTGLQQTPDLTDINSIGKLSFQFISLYNAIQTLQQAIDNYTGNTPSSNTSSGQTPEQTVLVGNMCTVWATAGPTSISAGFMVNLWNNGGVTFARNADDTAINSFVAHGVAMNNAPINQKVQVLLLGLFNFGGSVVPGNTYYLAAAGGLSTNPPAPGSGNLVQTLGFGLDTNSIFINPCLVTRNA